MQNFMKSNPFYFPSVLDWPFFCIIRVMYPHSLVTSL